jgi:galactonate dehydratase
MATRAVNDGFSVAKCAPFDECKAPFPGTGLPDAAENGLERVRSAKQVVGPDRTLYVDCHSRFDLGSAFELEEALRDAGAAWYEEPVDPLKNTDDLRMIHESADLPIAGAEHGYGVAVFERLIDEDVLDIVMPDVKFCGGPVEAYRIGVELESKRPGSVSMHCPSGPVSLLASAHATAAFGNVLPLEHAAYEVEWRHEVMEPFESIKDGHFLVPDGNGLGGRVDPVAVELRGEHWQE